MQAPMSGLGLKIEAITPEIQPVRATHVTRWNWEIEPAEAGTQCLHRTLSALLHVESQLLPLAIPTLERSIEVLVTGPQRTSAWVAKTGSGCRR
jgi:hypothetical protein